MNERIKELAEQAGVKMNAYGRPIPASLASNFDEFAELIVKECLLPRKPLTEERIWEIKLKSHQKFMSRKWIEETDTRSGHYEDVERHTDSPVTFARAIEAAHGIGE